MSYIIRLISVHDFALTKNPCFHVLIQVNKDGFAMFLRSANTLRPIFSDYVLFMNLRWKTNVFIV